VRLPFGVAQDKRRTQKSQSRMKTLRDGILARGARMSAVSEAFNYFNYYTQIEEYFWKKRGAHLLVSPLDWAILETWQRAGIPVEAVMKGIDRAFESYARSKRGAGGRTMKSLAYCVDAVLEAAEESREAAIGKEPPPGMQPTVRESFTREEIAAFLQRTREKLQRAAEKQTGANPQISAKLCETQSRINDLLPVLDSPARLDLEDLERRLTVLEEKLYACLMEQASEEILLGIRREMDRALAPYRRKMTAEQLTQLERRYLQKRLLESYDVPRLSLFYLT
jgi:hypothetical protein